VPTLQLLCCGVLARHLHELDSLDDLPYHLAAEVRGAIQRDRRLLSDDGLAVWMDAVFASAEARHAAQRRLNLRWAASLTDGGLGVLADQEAWSAALTLLDLGFCEQLSDAGVRTLAPSLHSLKTLVLTGCTRCGDGACEAGSVSARPRPRPLPAPAQHTPPPHAP
jgi:hypothetical protein